MTLIPLMGHSKPRAGADDHIKNKIQKVTKYYDSYLKEKTISLNPILRQGKFNGRQPSSR